MVACKTESVTEKEDVIELSDLQIDFGNDLKVGSTLSAQAIKQGISINLSINNGEKQRKTLEELFKECKDKKTLTITITNNGKSIYTITNDILPTKGYTFETERNDFTVSVEIDDYKIDFSTTFTVGPKEQGGSEEAPIEKPNEPVDPAPQTLEYVASVSFSTALESYQEESDTDLFTELRFSVTFDGDGYSAHTETFDLENLYGWLSESSALVGGYFTFELYAGSDGTEEPLYSFSKGWFRKPSSILLNAEGTYPYRCTLRVLVYSWEEYSGEFSVNIHPETGTPINIRSAALLWNVNADALPSPPQEVTLTAPIIRSIGDASSGRLARYKTEERLASNLDSVREYYGIDAADNAAAASALAACIGGSVGIEKNGDITLPFYIYDGFFIEDIQTQVPQYAISSDEEISLEGNFYYTDMALYISSLTNVNIDNATFSMGEDNSEYAVYVDMIESLYKDLNPNVTLDSDEILRSNEDNNFNDYKTPKLDFNLNSINSSDDLKNLTSLYKIYDKKNKLDDIKIDYYDNNILFDGNESKKEKILFDGNKLAEVVPNVSIDVFLKLTKLSKYKELKNLVITGSYTGEEQDINSKFTNVVFTGDVSGLKNSEEDQFNGVVYFMDKPYNNIKGDSVGPIINGIVKLDKLEGVSYDTFRVNNGVLDLRGRDGLNHNPLKGYNIETDSKKSINYSGHDAIYFTKENVDNIGGIDANSSIEDKFEILARRVFGVDEGGTPLYNVYVDNDKYDSIANIITPTLKSERHAVSKTPRTLEEFEYYGNYGEVENPNGLLYQGKFKTPAYDSYKGNFDGVNPDVKQKLEKDKDSGLNQIP
ncbi:MAG: hypothetical protein HDR53_08075 [Treponema sp.]|nr:hypothetical protein [Treponema sp.]